MLYIVEEHLNLGKIGRYFGLRFNSSINSSHETSGFEFLGLIHGCWIEDGPMRFCHVVRVINTHQILVVRS